ncbi:two-component response regulator-like PRR73 [Striga asiatica]|uniref:Two-component response regulator-like PRR73 n=1 Tax=Striga asiatica TaxID=4170 RepID=A0A5A7PHC7_STRAF|nr:two-component response regulator-like PRR73 [Striga asiatica]
MLGRVRASTMCSLELLEMERPPPKITKHDSLSIYESTLLKLKQGSHCNPSCSTEDSATIDNDTHCIMTTDLPNEAAITTDADCSSNSSSVFQSTDSSREQGSKNRSILYFFSKCKSSQHARDLNEKEVMIIDYSSSSSSS